MTACLSRLLLVVALNLGAASQLAAVEDAPLVGADGLPPAAVRHVDFEQDLAPLMVERCYDWHAEKNQEAALRLDNRADLLKGGDRGDHGPAI